MQFIRIYLSMNWDLGVGGIVGLTWRVSLDRFVE